MQSSFFNNASKLTFLIILAACLNACGSDKVQDNRESDEELCDDSLVIPDLPFKYRFSDQYLLIETPGGDLKATATPWGAHVPAYTGHPQGDAKVNINGLFATSKDELTELHSILPDGVCNRVDEICGLPYDSVKPRIPTYIVPTDTLEIFKVEPYALNPLTEDNINLPVQFTISGKACNYVYNLDHIGQIHEDLVEAMIKAGYADPRTQTKIGENLITGDPILLKKDSGLGVPSFVANVDDHYPGYYLSKVFRTPWVQIEFTIVNFEMLDGKDVGMYRLFSQEMQEHFERIIFFEVTNPETLRYNVWAGPEELLRPWLTYSELVLNASEPYRWDDYSVLYSNGWGWWEGDHTSCSFYQETRCDESLSLFRIHKESPYYDSALYHSSDVDFLIYREKGLQGTSDYQTVFGEIIHASPPVQDSNTSGTMTVKFRDGDLVTYQALSYRLDTIGKYLVINWGNEVADLGDINVPDVPPENYSCNGESTVCFTHSKL